MLSKEEIEEAKEYFKKRIDICNENADICDENDFNEEAIQLREEQKITENILQYIEQLETKEQKLIEKLEEDIETAKKENTPYAECKKESRMYLMNIGKIQAEEKILKIVKGERNE